MCNSFDLFLPITIELDSPFYAMHFLLHKGVKAWRIESYSENPFD
jgi:hypothetical protein